MKNILLLICFTLGGLAAKTQTPEFAPVGARWWYDQIEMFLPENQSYWYFEVEKDTLINSYSLKKIRQSHIGETFEITQFFYLYNDSGQLYIYHTETDILWDYFDLNADVGDTVKTTDGSGDFAYTVVDSIGTFEFAGYALKQFHIHNLFLTGFEFYTTIFTERIGPSGYFFANYGAVDPPPGGPLRCYEDDVIGLYGSDDIADCEYINTSIETIYSGSGFEIYPNPTQQSIFVHTSGKQLSFAEVVNSTGIMIRPELTHIEENLWQADIAELPAGIYFLLLTETTGATTLEKIIKY